MADRIPTYSSQEKVDVPGRFSADLPHVIDVGASINGIGTAFMQAVEPTLRDKAETQAIEDAGKATIVRSPEGGYVRANVTKGGGLVYTQAYHQALDTRQLNMMSEDYQTQLTDVATKWADDPTKSDPRAFFSFASGLGEAMVQQAPPSIRAQLDTVITREMGDRVRGFSQVVTKRNHDQLIDGLKTDLDSYSKAIASIARSGGDPADIASSIKEFTGKQIEVLQRMHDLGGIGEVAPYLRSIDVANFDDKQFVAGADAMQGLGGNLDHMTNEELARLGYFSDGTTDGGKVGKMDLGSFRQLFASPYWQHQAGEVARRVLSERVAAANQKATLEALGPKPETAGQVAADIQANNFNPAAGLTYQETVAANREYDSHGKVADQLRDPARRLQTLGYVARVGQAPIGTNDALRAMVMSSNPDDNRAAFDFIWNARDVTTGNTWTGLNWFNTLPEDVKALSEFDATMRRAGIDPTTRIREILDNRSGRNRGYNDIVSLFGRETDYANAATGAIATQFGVKPTDLGPAMPVLRKDFDRLMTINADLYPTKEQAMQASAKMLSNAWSTSSVFADGIGDKRLVGEGIPIWFMDRALALYPELRSGNPAGATFSNGRVKVRATGDSPANGYPFYEFVYFNDRNERLGRGAIYPMQRIVNAWHAYKQDVQAKAGKQAMDDTRPQPWKVSRVDGQVKWVPNTAEVDAWEKRQAKKPPFDPLTFGAQLAGAGYHRY